VEEKYSNTRGKPAYSHELMAYLDGGFSSWKIAKLAMENVIYMYFMGIETPDFRTIVKDMENFIYR